MISGIALKIQPIALRNRPNGGDTCH